MNDFNPPNLGPTPDAYPVPSPQERGRLVSIDQLYYRESVSAEATVTESHFSRWLLSGEQPYVRRMSIGEAWMVLDTGWLESCGMLFVRNEEGRFLTIPTVAERAEVEARAVQLGVSFGSGIHPFAIIRPGESARFEPSEVCTLRLRCLQGEARVTLSVIPE